MTTTIATVLLQGDMSNPFAALFGGVMLLVWLAILLVTIIGGWKTFEKAGQPGWAIFIPIYNFYILLKIAGRPGWWLLLLLFPLVNIAIAFIVAIDVAKSFGEGAVFGILLLAIFSPIGYLMLGFGNYRYLGPAAAHP